MPFWKRKHVPPSKTDLAGQQGFGKAFALHYTQHRQPDPGIAAFSYDTEALPLYTAIGWGVQNSRQFKSAPSNPVVYQLQGISLTTIGNPGNLAGTFVSTGLIDPESNPGDIMAYALNPPGSLQIPAGMA